MSYEKYAEIRDSKGLSDYRVAQETGVSTATLTSWKKGLYKPKVDKLQKLADYLKVSIVELL